MIRRILILASNPSSTSRLRLDKEVREIENGLQRSRNRNNFIISCKFASRMKDIRRAMLDYSPSIVHFCGHGEMEGIIVEQEGGGVLQIRIDALADFFKLFSDSIECVLLNACYTEAQAQAIANHIDYVVGMTKGIADEDAIEFAVAFYDALGSGRSYEFAFEIACNALGILDHSAEAKEHNPILKKKSL